MFALGRVGGLPASAGGAQLDSPGKTCDLRGGSFLLSRGGGRGWAFQGGAWDAEANYGNEAQDTSGADFPKIGHCEKHHLGTC